MSSSSSVSDSDDFLGFSSVSNGATGKVIETNKDIHSAASSANVSLVKNKTFIDMSSSDEAVDLEAEVRAERAKENWILRHGYHWVNPKVREYFSQYFYSSALHSYLSKTYIYSSYATEEIISFRHARTIDNVYHGCESESCKFFYLYECLFTNIHVRFPLDEF